MHSRILGIVEKNFYEENIDNYNWNLDIFEDETPGFADYLTSLKYLLNSSGKYSNIPLDNISLP